MPRSIHNIVAREIAISLLAICGLVMSCTARRSQDNDENQASSDHVVVEGGMSTGGGLLIGTAANPWFLQNTNQVSYCIEIDDKSFSATHESARNSIERSLSRWKQSFAQANNSYYTQDSLQPYAPLMIGTQTFVEEPCKADTALRFQLGVITAPQLQLIPDRNKVIAVAVRTEYDAEQLRGRGFVYIAPNKGSFRPASATFGDDPWSACNGCILEATITHELGHVFGVPHSLGSRISLMSEKFVEIISDKAALESMNGDAATSDWIDNTFPLGGIFSFPKKFSYHSCDSRKAPKFFGYSDELKCLDIEFDNDILNISAAPDKGSVPTKIGEISSGLSSSSGSAAERGSEDLTLVRIKLTPEQKVFTKIPDEARKFNELMGPGSQNRYFSGAYRSIDGTTTRPVMVRLRPNAEFEIVGELDGLLSPIVAN